MNIDELKELFQLLDDKEIAEFELEEEGMKLRIRKAAASTNHTSPTGVTLPVPVPATIPSAVAPAAPPQPASTAPAAAAEPPVASEGPDLSVVKSPIVGTFYRAPDPNSAPFVSVGDRVRVGQVLCIIEAMKLMNEIECEVPGEILKVHVENGQPVQYGEPLFDIRPDR